MRKILLAMSLFLATILLFSGCSQKSQQLTESQVDEVNKAFEPLLPIHHDKYEFIINPICYFISSAYDKPENLDFEEFIKYFSTENMLDMDELSEEEFKLLKELKDFPFKDVETLENMPVPLQRKPKNEIDAVLQKYMGITVDPIEKSSVAYLGDPYNSFYTYTSDAGFGQFICTGGEIKDDMVMLYSDSMVLTLKKSNDNYFIVSHKEK